MIYLLVAALCVATFVIGFLAGYGFHAWRERLEPPVTVAGPFLGGRR